MAQPVTTKKFTNAFTSIRGIVCMFVIFTHNNRRQGNESLANASNIAVPTFFVLSAYLLTRNILNEIAPRKKKDQEPNSVFGKIFISYTIRRIFRIYPAFITAVTINYAMFRYYGSQKLPYGNFNFEFPLEVLKCEKISIPYWTMKPEIFFYLAILPIFASIACVLMKVDYRFFKDAKFKTFYVFLGIVTIATIYMMNDIWIAEPGPITNLWGFRERLYPHIPFFMYGVLFGTLSFYIQGYEYDFTNRIKKIAFELATLAICLFFYYSNEIIARKYLGHTKTEWWQQLPISAFVIAVLLLLLEKGGTDIVMGRVLSNQMLMYLGKWSYSIYLVHIAAMEWVMIHTPEPLNQNMSEVDEIFRIYVAAIFLGFLVNTVIEEPVFKLSKPAIKYVGLLGDKIMELIGEVFSIKKENYGNLSDSPALHVVSVRIENKESSSSS